MTKLAELKKAYRRERESITLSLPGDTPLGVPVGHWERKGKCIVATYTEEELAWALVLNLLARLEHGLEVLSNATGEDRSERLLNHWDTLNRKYENILASLG
jgi:hypothetical protein